MSDNSGRDSLLAMQNSARQFVTGVTTPSNTARSLSSVLAEVSPRFAPYNDNLRARLAGRSSTGWRLNRSLIQTRLWSHRVCCLAGPNDMTTPGESRRIALTEDGLGDGIIAASE